MKEGAKGILFVVSAPSGSGKTTLCDQLLSDFAAQSHLNHNVGQKKLVRSISVTTRTPRPGEEQGKDYFFISDKEFESKKTLGELLEWAVVFNNHYGTPRRFLEEMIAKGDDVLLSIDVQGAMQVKKSYPDCVLIFVLPPSIEALKDRLSQRSTENEAEVSKRLEVAHRELTYLPRYTYQVVNDTVEKALVELRSIIISERCRIRKR